MGWFVVYIGDRKIWQLMTPIGVYHIYRKYNQYRITKDSRLIGNEHSVEKCKRFVRTELARLLVDLADFVNNQESDYE